MVESEQDEVERIAEEMSDEEKLILEAWNAPFVKDQLVDIPYAGSIGAVTIAGVLHLRSPVSRSSTEGVCAGAVNGTYDLDADEGRARLYGPFLRVEVNARWSRRSLRWRVCTQNIPSGWSCGSWQHLLSW